MTDLKIKDLTEYTISGTMEVKTSIRQNKYTDRDAHKVTVSLTFNKVKLSDILETAIKKEIVNIQSEQRNTVETFPARYWQKLSEAERLEKANWLQERMVEAVGDKIEWTFGQKTEKDPARKVASGINKLSEAEQKAFIMEQAKRLGIKL